MNKIGKLVLLLLIILSFIWVAAKLLLNKNFFLFSMLILVLFFILFTLYITKIYSKKSIFFTRNKLAILIVAFLMILIIIRLIKIQFIDREKYFLLMNNQVSSVNKEIGERGIIYDKKGKKIAFNKRLYTIYIDPSLLNDEKYSSDILTDIKLIKEKKLFKLDKNIVEELKEMAKENKKYKILAKNIDDDIKKKLEKILTEYHQEIENKKSYKTALQFEKNIEREYYMKNDYEKLIGMVRFTNTSKANKIGISGLEKQYEKYLIERERNISKLYGLNKNGILPQSKDILYHDLNGKNLHLTIDVDINYILNDEVKTQFLKTNAYEAYGIIMDPNNGQILATASYSKEKKLLRNNIFQSQYEPGSIFKPIIVAAALNEGLIKEDSKFNVGDGRIQKHRKIIKESSRTTKGILTTKEVITKSSNVGMVLISDYFSNELFEKYLKDFGLYGKTGVDFPDELKPYTVPYKNWDGLKKNTMAFGQGIVLSPVQMITAFSALVNGGTLYRPYLVEKITDNDGITIARNTPKAIRKIINEKSSEQIKDMMEATVENGTGKRAFVEGFRLGGKTGTAQLSAGRAGYVKNEYLASFIGFFPVDKPRYVVLVMIMRPQGDEQYKKFGGYVSAPVVGNIARRIIKEEELSSQTISKINTTVSVNDNQLKNINFLEELNTMPDLNGISLNEVFEIFKETDLDIEVVGVGLVAEQSPKAGESLNGIKKIKIILK